MTTESPMPRAVSSNLIRLLCAIVFLGAFFPSAARAHATLIASQPAANSHLTESPPTIHLTFSEEVVPRLCQIRIVKANGEKIELGVVGDPQNVRAVSATPAILEPGSYTIEWRVLSADGHPAEGSFEFSIGAPVPSPGAETAAASTVIAPRDSVPEPGARVAGVPGPLAALRGAAMAALLGVCGLLLLVMRRNDGAIQLVRRYCDILMVAAAVFFAAHLIGWLIHTAPDQRLTSDWASAVIGTAPGKVEIIRTGLVLLAAWALLLARRPQLAGGFALAAVAASGAAGHSAALTPALSIPLKTIHLVAASLWFGGLLWLVLSPAADEESTMVARRVSRIALVSVLIIAISGVAQALIVAPLSQLVASRYGLVLGVKTALFLLLILFGWYNRFRLLPRIDSEAQRVRLRASAARESTIMLLVLLIAGLLAYVPTPEKNVHSVAAQSVSRTQ